MRVTPKRKRAKKRDNEPEIPKNDVRKPVKKNDFLFFKTVFSSFSIWM